MAVSKKIGPACVRNRVKRVLREFFRQHQALLIPQVDVVVVPKKHLRTDQVALAPVTGELLPLLSAVRRLDTGLAESGRPGARNPAPAARGCSGGPASDLRSLP